MKKLIFPLLFCISLLSNAQSFIQAYQDRANQVTQNNINTYLQEFENLGVKKTGSVANANTLTWIKNKYLSFGYVTSQIVEDPYSFNSGGGTINSKNLVITKTGTKYPNTFVIICGHFDSIVGPGVNDNGSGTSVILEIARILKDIPTEYSIRFIHFTGEEQGLYGSTHYVQNVVNATNPKMNIKLVFNIDEVGGQKGNNNNTIYCDKDQSNPNSNNVASAQITQELATCTQLYSPLQTAFDPAYASDYVPFQQNGEVITGFYEYIESNYPHTVNDTYANVDTEYVFKVAKAAVGAAQHFAVASTVSLTVEECTTETIFSSLKIYPNPAKDLLHLGMLNPKNKNFTFEILDMNGNILLRNKNSLLIDVSSLKTGYYFGVLTMEGQKTKKKIIIK